MDIALDLNLQLILVESLDAIMYNHVVNCKDAKHIWDTIITINEGTKKVRENRLEILTSEYEHFRSQPGEDISDGFERYNKLINNLHLHGKFYTLREINRKFLLTLPTHLEHIITAIRESIDLNQTSLEKIFGILKTYEMEQVQQKKIYGKGRVVSTSTALVGEASVKMEDKVVQPYSSDKEVIVAEYGKTAASQGCGEFYSLEELEQLEDESMAMVVRKFDNFRFRRSPNFRFKSTGNRFRQGGSSSSRTSGGYETGMVDRSRIRCFKCNEIGHFATECHQAHQDARRVYASGKKKANTSHVAHDKSWDDTDSDEEKVGDFALMAKTEEIRYGPNSQVKHTDSELVRQLGGSLVNA